LSKVRILVLRSPTLPTSTGSSDYPHLQPLHLPALGLHPPQPPPPAFRASPPTAKPLISFLASWEPQLGHWMTSSRRITSSSNSRWQSWHSNSKVGIASTIAGFGLFDLGDGFGRVLAAVGNRHDRREVVIEGGDSRVDRVANQGRGE